MLKPDTAGGKRGPWRELLFRHETDLSDGDTAELLQIGTIYYT